ncbi:hypothetical protein CI789_04100 [Erwinia persicina]|nr:hypothetical protein CI789_04100 [Erwinia persicina]
MHGISVTVFYSESELYNDMIKKIKRFYFPLKFDTYVIANTYRKEVFIKDGGMEKLIPVPDLNNEMEFSGYYGGLQTYLKETLRKNVKNEISAFFLNDTVFSHGKFRKIEQIAFVEWKIKVFFRNIFYSDTNNDAPALLGFQHKPSFLTELEGFSEGYINSKFFVMKGIPLQIIDKAFALNEIVVYADVLTSKYSNNVFLNDSYNNFLANWLHGQEKENSKVWYKSQPLNDENRPYFVSKAKSIIHEHLLSLRIKNSKSKIYCLARSSFSLKVIAFLTGVKY